MKTEEKNILKQFLVDIHTPDTLIQFSYDKYFTHKTLGLGGDKGMDSFIDFVEKARETKREIFLMGGVDKQSPMRSLKAKTYTKVINGEKIVVTRTPEERIKYPEEDRSSNIDVLRKSYVYFDFDVYKEIIQKYEFTPTQKEVKEACIVCVELLTEAGFDDWSYLVFSGGGFHLYFIDEPREINAKHHSLGYEYFAKQMSKVIGLPYDGQCRNITRISRLPYSFNAKRRWGEDEEVEVLWNQLGVRSDLLTRIVEKGKKIEEKREQEEIAMDKEKQKKIEQSLKEGRITEEDIKEGRVGDDGKKISSVVLAINSIPINNLVMMVFPGWEQTGKNFITPEEGRLSGAFLPETGENFLYCGGSQEFTNRGYYKKAVDCFNFIRIIKELDYKDTFTWFEDNFFEIKRIAHAERMKWREENILSKQFCYCASI